MIKRMNMPLWAIYCRDSLKTRPLPDGGVIVDNCLGRHECWGCNPIGKMLEFDPHTLEEVAVIYSQNFPLSKLDGLWLTNELIEEIIAPYKDSSDQFYYVRSIRADLDSITIFKVVKPETVEG